MDHHKVLRILDDIDTDSDNQIYGALLIIQGMAEMAEKAEADAVEAESATAKDLTAEKKVEETAAKDSKRAVTILKSGSKDNTYDKDDVKHEDKTSEGPPVEDQGIETFQATVIIVKGEDKDAAPTEEVVVKANVKTDDGGVSQDDDWSSWYVPSGKKEKKKSKKAVVWVDEPKAETVTEPLEEDVWSFTPKAKKGKTSGEPGAEEVPEVSEPVQTNLDPNAAKSVEVDDWGSMWSVDKKKKKSKKAVVWDDQPSVCEPSESIEETTKEPVEEDVWSSSKPSKKGKKSKEPVVEDVPVMPEPVQTDPNSAAKLLEDSWGCCKSKKKKSKKAEIWEYEPAVCEPSESKAEIVAETVTQPLEVNDWNFSKSAKKSKKSKKVVAEEEPSLEVDAIAKRWEEDWGFAKKKSKGQADDTRITNESKTNGPSIEVDDAWADFGTKKTNKDKKEGKKLSHNQAVFLEAMGDTVAAEEIVRDAESKSFEEDDWGWGVKKVKKSRKSAKTDEIPATKTDEAPVQSHNMWDFGSKPSKKEDKFDFDQFLAEPEAKTDSAPHEDVWAAWGSCGKKKKKAKQEQKKEPREQLTDSVETAEEKDIVQVDEVETKAGEKTEEKPPEDDGPLVGVDVDKEEPQTEKPPKIENMNALTTLLPNMKWDGMSTSWYPRKKLETEEHNLAMMGEMYSMFKRMYSGQRVARSILGVILTNCLYLHNKENPDGHLKPPYRRSYIKVDRITTGEDGENFVLDSADTILNHVVCDFKASFHDGPSPYSTFVCCTPRSDCTDQQLIAHCAANTVGLQQKTKKDTGYLFATYGCCCLSSSEWIFFCYDAQGTLHRSRSMSTSTELSDIVQLLRGILSEISDTRKVFSQPDIAEEQKEEKAEKTDEQDQAFNYMLEKAEQNAEASQSTEQLELSSKDQMDQVAGLVEEDIAVPTEDIPVSTKDAVELTEDIAMSKDDIAIPTECEVVAGGDMTSQPEEVPIPVEEEPMPIEAGPMPAEAEPTPADGENESAENIPGPTEDKYMPEDMEAAAPEEDAVASFHDAVESSKDDFIEQPNALEEPSKDPIEAPDAEPALQRKTASPTIEEEPKSYPELPPEKRFEDFKSLLERSKRLETQVQKLRKEAQLRRAEQSDAAADAEKCVDDPHVEQCAGDDVSLNDCEFEDDKVSIGEDGVIAFED